MENGKYRIIIFNIVSAVLLLPVFCYGYANETTHPALTNETVDVFDYHYPNLTLNDNERELVMEGSKEEDEPIYRPLNHFYDPVYNVGLLNMGITAKNWSQNTRAQAGFSNLAGVGLVKDLFSADSDYSWERAIYDYVYGDKNRALIALGHNLHLIQDMSVPPHVRNDQHLVGVDDSPYEVFTKKFDTEAIKGLSDDLKNEPIVLKDNLNDYFDYLASFTNANFFSKDTIFGSVYSSPMSKFVVGNSLFHGSSEIIVSTKLDGLRLNLVRVKKTFDRDLAENIYTYSISDDDNLILTDYWNILSKQAVLTGAGVIKLFFDDVAKEKQTMALYNENKSYLAKLTDKITGIFGGNSNEPSANLASVVDSGSETFSDQQEPLTNFEESAPAEDQTVPQYNSEIALVPTNNYNNNESQVDLSETVTENTEDTSSETTNPQEAPVFYLGNGYGGGGGVPQAQEVQETQTQNENLTQTQQDTDSSGESNQSEEISEDNETNQEPEENNIVENIDSPMITSTTTDIFTSTSIAFSGTASSTNIISTDFSSTTSSADTDGFWSLVLEGLNQGMTTINFYASNQSQTATSAPTTIDVFVDSVAPGVSLSVDECSQSNCLLATTTAKINAYWSSLDADFDYFILNDNGNVSTTTATSTQLTLSGNQIYTFGVSAVDKNGNVSDESTQTIEINDLPVVINEVSWMGTTASAYDEWVELHNNTNSDISLDGWTLYAEDGLPYIKLSGSISAKGYYLIEWGSDDVVSDVKADLVYGNGAATLSLNNSGEHLMLAQYLNNSTTTVDEILKRKNWNGSNYANSRYSMERYDPTISGTDWNNWFANDGHLIKNGKTATGENINGTPRAKNSVDYLISTTGTLRSDTVLTKENSPYIVDENLVVDSGVTLTVESGVVIKLTPDSTRPFVKIKGKLLSSGTTNEPVVFTSLSDDEYGGDLNNDGICEPGNASSTSACPSPGDWKYVLFEPESEGSVIANTIFRYGGNDSSGAYKSMVYVNGSDVVIEDSTFDNSSSKGLVLYGMTSATNVSGNVFSNNNTENSHGVSYPFGLYVSNGAPVIRNNTFDNNGYGAYFSNSSATVDSNLFRNNKNEAVYSSGSNTFSNNTGENNGTNAILLEGNLSKEGSVNLMSANALPYVITGNVDVVADSTLQIGNGAVVKFKDKRFDVEGRLEADGALFTVVADDSDGTDIENNGPAETILPGHFSGLRMNSGATSEIKNSEIRYMKCGVSYENSPISLENVIFRNNAMAICFDADSATTTITNLIFDGNTATSSSYISF